MGRYEGPPIYDFLDNNGTPDLSAYRAHVLPPMTDLELGSVKLARKGRSACANHLADMGILPEEEIPSRARALKRVAKRIGDVDEETGYWITALGRRIFGHLTDESEQ